ncbi:hypothetical protein [Phytohabitans aurantiacus]|uniref:Uncharacterized protein n=1 Tax=Phytohabitans aurantiacus TaxID=3016789 RepID=A0ABQ5QS80_9ACTN|nr:hypothetical protein [Phytohabitans aurantiacus]GLH96732.1 hypothetical protein Pa4123_20060 [Phytohabitans aurantiacus]
MSTHLEDRLASVLTDAAEAAPVPGYDPVEAVRGRQRRRRNRHAVVAAACAVAVAAAGSVATVRLAVPTVDHRVGSVASPDRIPDFANLASPEKVWPRAVHRLPATLPDGSAYTVAQVLGDGRYLVLTGEDTVAPSVYDQRAGTVTALATAAPFDGLARPGTRMARAIGDRAVWFVSGFRNNKGVSEAWTAPLRGGTPVRLVSMAEGVGPRFMVAGNGIAWEKQLSDPSAPGGISSVIRTVSLDGGGVRDVPGTKGFTLAQVEPWVTSQRIATGLYPKTSGEMLNVVTGERRRWSANDKVQFLRCGPTWCSGDGSGGVVLQNLDGTGYTELGYGGSLEQRMGGRLAVGTLGLPDWRGGMIWDRTTGRAARYTTPKPAGRITVVNAVINSDSEPPVQIWLPDDKTMMVLDLTAIR